MKPGFGSAGGWEARRWARAEAGVRAGVVVARRWARRRVAERDFEATLEGGGGVSERWERRGGG
jgi:hypothetical protein